jgi:transmembrane sensor
MFNRYNAVKLVVADDRIGAQKVVGWFDSNDPQGFAQALEVTMGSKSERVGDSLRLTASKK